MFLCQPYQVSELGLKIWDPNTDRRQQADCFPILTPSYPCSNSCYNVSKASRKVMMDEFKRGFEVVSEPQHTGRAGAVCVACRTV